MSDRIQIDELRRKLKVVPREELTQSDFWAALLELDERLRRVEGAMAHAGQFTCQPGDPAYGLKLEDAVAFMDSIADPDNYRVYTEQPDGSVVATPATTRVFDLNSAEFVFVPSPLWQEYKAAKATGDEHAMSKLRDQLIKSR